MEKQRNPVFLFDLTIGDPFVVFAVSNKSAVLFRAFSCILIVACLIGALYPFACGVREFRISNALSTALMNNTVPSDPLNSCCFKSSLKNSSALATDELKV